MKILKLILNFFNPDDTGKHHYINMPENMLLWLRLPKLIFRISLIGGTFLLILFLITGNKGIIGPGIFYLIWAFKINIAVLCLMLVCGCFYNRYFWLILQKTSIVLINIPIAFMYYYIVIQVWRWRH